MEMTPKWPCSPDEAFNVGSERNFPDFDSGVMNVMVGSPGESQECNVTLYDVTEIVQHMRTHTKLHTHNFVGFRHFFGFWLL